MKTDDMFFSEEEKLLNRLEPLLCSFCKGRWTNLEPDDRLSEAKLYAAHAIHCLPHKTGRFLVDLFEGLTEYMDQVNRNAPSRLFGCPLSLDRTMTANGAQYNLYDILAGSPNDESSIIVDSFLNSLPSEHRNIVLDIRDRGLSCSFVARKHGISPYVLKKLLRQLGKNYLKGNWVEK